MAKREDDGSQEWFDQLAKNRIRRDGGASNPFSAYGKFTPTAQMQEIDINAISDPEVRKRILLVKEAGQLAIEHYTKAPHFGPAHLGGKPVDRITASNYAVQVDMDQMSAGINARHMQYRQQLNEVDSTDAQLQRMPAHMRQYAAQTLGNLENNRPAFANHNLTRLHEVGNSMNQGQPQQQQQYHNQPQQQVQACRLVDGYPCFRAIDTGPWPGLEKVVLARGVGQVVPQVSMHEFVVRRVVDVFVVPPQQTALDMNMINNNPQLRTQLVEVQAPPASGIGVLLVPREALGIRGGMGDQRGILTDARMRAAQGQQQLLLNSARQGPQTSPQRPGFLPPVGKPQNRGILKG